MSLHQELLEVINICETMKHDLIVGSKLKFWEWSLFLRKWISSNSKGDPSESLSSIYHCSKN